MGIEKILGRTGGKIVSAGLAGIFGLYAIGAPVPAYAQQDTNTKSPSANVVYVPCTPEQKMAMEKPNKDEGLGINSTLLSFFGWAIPGLSNKPEGQIVGGWVSELARMQHEKEVAREGRSQINVNQGQQQPVTYVPEFGCKWTNSNDKNNLSVKKRIGVPLAANNFEDFNKDGEVDISEFIGIKDKFYDDETMFVFLYNPLKEEGMREVNWKLYTPKGEKLLEDSITSPPFKAIYIGKGLLAKELPKYAGYGIYTVVWSSPGGDPEKFEFEIRPASERLEKK
ncbi:MAG: hypothetical protein AABX79_03280 [Nanoarchaeota archaeon]